MLSKKSHVQHGFPTVAHCARSKHLFLNQPLILAQNTKYFLQVSTNYEL